MHLIDLLAPGSIKAGITVSSKKKLLQELSGILAEETQIPQRVVFDSLLSREKLGSTALGKGVAIPHGRVKQQTNAAASLIQLKAPVDYDAADGVGVKLAFSLVVPEDFPNHLEILRQAAELFSNDEIREELINAESTKQIREILNQWTAQ
ncbi:MAG: PTS sugar transporter subunit IIA [bacterium]